MIPSMRNSLLAVGLSFSAIGCSPSVCDSGFELAEDGNCYPAAPELADPKPDNEVDEDTDGEVAEDTATYVDSGVDTGPSPHSGRKDDFSLKDLNLTSPRFGEMVSPRDYLQKVSGWYFLHAN